MKNLCLFLALLSIGNSVFSSTEDSDKIKQSFDTYISLNTLFIDSLGGSESKGLRSRLEKYSEVELANSLYSAERIVCNDKNIEIVKSLFSLMLNTLNSANEYPSQVLGEMFICQPDLVATAYKALPEHERLEISRTFSFGFENAAYNNLDNEKIEKLRARLKFLLSSK